MSASTTIAHPARVLEASLPIPTLSKREAISAPVGRDLFEALSAPNGRDPLFASTWITSFADVSATECTCGCAERTEPRLLCASICGMMRGAMNLAHELRTSW